MPAVRQYRHPIIVALNLFFLFFCLAAIYHLTQKTGFPSADRISFPIIINGVTISDDQQLEFFVSRYSIGTPVEVSYSTGSPSPQTVKLTAYYSPDTIISGAIIAFLVYAFGLLVYILRKDDPAAGVFHVGSVFTAASLLGVKTAILVKPLVLGYLIGGYFFIAYTLIPVIFLHFTFLFPAVRFVSYRRLIPWFYAVASIIGPAYCYRYAGAVSASFSIEAFEQALRIGAMQNMFVLIVFLCGLANLILSYRSTRLSSERRKLRWCLFGLCIGPAPFIFFWVLPQAVAIGTLVPELVFKFFLLLIPLSFAIAILKYRALDIDLLINRSVVYTMVITVFLVLYVTIVGVAARMVTVWSAQSSLTVSIIIAVITALLFDPLRKRIQAFVDRRFFRIQYNFREAQRSCSREIANCIDVQEIARLIVSRTRALMPVERIGFFTVGGPKRRIQLLAHENYDMLERHGVPLEAEKLQFSLRQPVALPAMMEKGIAFERGDEEVLRRWGIAVILPLMSRQEEILGFLVLGTKKSGMRFAAEDIDLLLSLTGEAGLAIERLTLQQKLILERAETERLAELNAAKSYFVSSVSHDLKTPLTSIKMFAEILRERKQLPEKDRDAYLGIIEGESDRLTRLINNVLDFAKVERGIKEYAFEEIELNEIVQRVACSMEYQFSMEHCALQQEFIPEPLFLTADADAIMELLYNLFSNALRYTPEEKNIVVCTAVENGAAILSVQDNGIGIAPEEVEKICTPFFRTGAGKEHGKGGTGLGLSVVKHIIDAHHGTLEVRSAPGAGSTFIVRLPLSLS